MIHMQMMGRPPKKTAIFSVTQSLEGLEASTEVKAVFCINSSYCTNIL